MVYYVYCCRRKSTSACTRNRSIPLLYLYTSNLLATRVSFPPILTYNTYTCSSIHIGTVPYTA